MNVPIGWQSIIGWATFLSSTIATASIAISEHSAELSGPGKWTALLALIAYVTTAAGRYLQAHKMLPSLTPLLPFASGLVTSQGVSKSEPPLPPPGS